MDVFALRDQLTRDYATFIESFIEIRDERIRTHVERELAEGLLWPDPLLQLNPSFEPGAWIDQLVADGKLHPLCRQIFRLKYDDKPDKPLRLHRHQTEALEAARSGDNYVLTTGTASGKSLAYIIPIVDHILRRGSGKGIQAIVVYPMNALANSQVNELEKFLCRGLTDPQPPVRFARYTGQESDEERQRIITHPPDILLTNYVMLELLLTRPHERNIVNAARGLRFLVLDELHTYRGRQGADVGLLVRRVRDACHSPDVQCVGTSATLACGGTWAEQQVEVSRLASRLFGSQVRPELVIGETLRRATPEANAADPAFVAELTARLTGPMRRLPKDFGEFVADPLSSWLESTFGLTVEPKMGQLKRATPISICGPDGAAARLSHLTGTPEDHCKAAIQEWLLAGYRFEHPETGFPAFAFRLHQFLSRGDTVYAALDSPEQRHITTHAQQFVPGDRSRVLLPLAFCQECGQEYFTVRRVVDAESGVSTFVPRALTDQSREDDQENGFLYFSPQNPWPADAEEIVQRLPDDWLEVHQGAVRVKKARRSKLPQPVWLNPAGREDPQGSEFHFLGTPFPFCLQCGAAYSSRQRSDWAKLTTLAAGGRSTATTVTSLSTLLALRRDESLPKEARKLLSFTDNRQDASLQAGHFNDFVEVGLLRSGLYRAVQKAGSAGITHEELPQRVFDALDLPLEQYAADPAVLFQAKANTERALREVLAYRIYHDLRRGWRVTAPNLEQCGLLKIRYASLDELCAEQSLWQDRHPVLVSAAPADRSRVAQVLLDFLRRSLAIKVDYLEQIYQERIQQQSSQWLQEPWAIDENERMESSAIAFPRSRRPGEFAGNVFISGRSGMGLYLRRMGTFPGCNQTLSVADTEIIIGDLLEVLRVAGLVQVVQEASGEGDPPGYQVPAAALIWVAGDGTEPFHDPIRMPRQPDIAPHINAFFVDFYQNVAAGLQGIEAREHTAQVLSEEREEREKRFRSAELPILYCSPTMELGVDIAELNAVNMRNVPPTPANYAQRSGRAGRQGQPALVFTYCTSGSPHDQYFYKRPERMVYGAVATPRLDLSNEDLVRAHVQAVWLAETGLSLGQSLKDLLDLSGDDPSLELLPSVRQGIASPTARERAYRRASSILATLHDELSDSDWYTDGWLPKALAQVEERFDRTCDRWRGLYRSALGQRARQNKIILDHSRPASDRERAKQLRAEAEAQLELLTGGDDQGLYQSDFYSYRYFASEGFLPGYSFPRLPLSAFIPGRKKLKGRRDDFLSRPRFLAIAEFGPRSILYHEGSRYVVNKVILPVDDELLTTSAKFCVQCSYLHPLEGDAPGPDLCECCGKPLDHPLRALFRMQNVSTRRRDRINSDEEERMRMGYQLKTGLRFVEHGARPGRRVATVLSAAGTQIMRLTYGHTATLWRINLGWRRRRDKQVFGFVLDTERGYWARNEQALEEDPEDPMSQSTAKVIPFVEDHRNCLLLEPTDRLPTAVMASLQPALKNAIQVLYHLEDDELAAEPLPTADDRRLILLYESAEGGAGVLRQLLDHPQALAEVAREALQLCHFDLETGADQRRAPRAKEDCEAACYDCLMSYTNQVDHPLLDRQLIRDLLLELAQSSVKASPAAVKRSEHLQQLKALCESDLEREWLDFLEEHNLRLPDEAQVLIPQCGTRPDFLYREQMVAVYVDGPYHLYPARQARDAAQTESMEDLGYLVIRFGLSQDWESLSAQHAALFGPSGI